jgi:hypothetical protein
MSERCALERPVPCKREYQKLMVERNEPRQCPRRAVIPTRLRLSTPLRRRSYIKDFPDTGHATSHFTRNLAFKLRRKQSNPRDSGPQLAFPFLIGRCCSTESESDDAIVREDESGRREQDTDCLNRNPITSHLPGMESKAVTRLLAGLIPATPSHFLERFYANQKVQTGRNSVRVGRRPIEWP